MIINIQSAATGWGLTGNAPGNDTSFIGTTSNQTWLLKANNITYGTLAKTGLWAFGTVAPVAGTAVTITGTGTTSATWALGVYNSTPTAIFRVRNDGLLEAGNLADGWMSLGVDAGLGNVTASNNTFLGVSSGKQITVGYRNTCVGQNSGTALTSGLANTFIGYNAGVSHATGNNIVGVGAFARGATGGSGDVAIGYQALQVSVGDENTAVGDQAGLVSTGDNNAFFGSNAGLSNTTGGKNLYAGQSAGRLNVGGSNLFLGYGAGMRQTVLSNALIIDNQDRSTAGAELTNALVYGVFAAATTNQSLTINGHVLISEDLQFTTKAINTTAGDGATINSPTGRFRKDTSGSTFTLTNSYITANSIIILQYASDPGITGFDNIVVAGAGSAVITFTTSGVAAAPTSNTDMNFLVIN